jgi:hypothetical protein
LLLQNIDGLIPPPLPVFLIQKFWGWDLRVHISHKFPGFVVVNAGTTLGEPLVEDAVSHSGQTILFALLL